tara:strand:- start:410 stop:571 length:162 start_codon:yes stop_codon:yes gene_type:complete
MWERERGVDSEERSFKNLRISEGEVTPKGRKTIEPSQTNDSPVNQSIYQPLDI